MIKLSILIPCYNVESYVGKTIDSLRRQLCQDVEFIFVNDGSTDNTQELISAFAATDKRAVVINKQNEGVSAARNDAVRIAKGKYVFLLDGDDYLSDNAVEIICRTIERDDSDLLISNINIIKDGGCIYPYNHKIAAGCYTPHDLYRNCKSFPIPPQLVYKKEIIDRHKILFDPTIHSGEVYLFTVQFMQYALRVSVILDRFYNYVQRGDSAVHKPNYSKDITAVNAIDKLYDYGKEFAKTDSFNATAFATTAAVTYVKYVHNRDNKAEEVVRAVLKNRNFYHAMMRTAFGFHRNPKKRLLALYMAFTQLWGFRTLVRINKLINRKNNV